MKKLTIIILVTLFCMIVFSFYSFGAQQLKVALLLPGVITDQGWNALAYNALKAVEEKYNAQISYIEKVTVSDDEALLRQYSEAKYDLIFGHGFEFIDVMKRVAKNFPNTAYCLTSADVYQEPNLSSVWINVAQDGFLGGAIAAILTKTNKVALIGGVEFPSSMEEANGFIKGAKYINPNVEALTPFTGTYEDISKAKEVAKVLISQGVDIIMPDVDMGDRGVIEAVEEANNKGLMVRLIGDIGDMALNCHSPELVITSVIRDYGVAFNIVAEDVLRNEYKGKVYRMGMKEGVIHLAPFRHYEEILTEEEKTKINQLAKLLELGEIDLEDCYIKSTQ
jgi:basic membrane protein A